MLPAIILTTYDTDTWTLVKQAQNKLWPHRPNWNEVRSTSRTTYRSEIERKREREREREKEREIEIEIERERERER